MKKFFTSPTTKAALLAVVSVLFIVSVFFMPVQKDHIVINKWEIVKVQPLHYTMCLYNDTLHVTPKVARDYTYRWDSQPDIALYTRWRSLVGVTIIMNKGY